MINVKIEDLGKTLDEDFKHVLSGTIKGAVKSGDNAHKFMLSYLNTFPRLRQRRPGQSKLRNNIKTYVNNSSTSAKFSFGIGKKSLLNTKASYWYVLDKGRYFSGGSVPRASRGFFKDKGGRRVFVPSPTGRQDQLFYPNNRFPVMAPRKPYKGIRYIAKTYDNLLRGLGKNINEGISATKS